MDLAERTGLTRQAVKKWLWDRQQLTAKKQHRQIEKITSESTKPGQTIFRVSRARAKNSEEEKARLKQLLKRLKCEDSTEY